MNLRFVEAFHWAVTLKSVTRAAEKLFLTQSAVSSRIAALEHNVGTGTVTAKSLYLGAHESCRRSRWVE